MAESDDVRVAFALQEERVAGAPGSQLYMVTQLRWRKVARGDVKVRDAVRTVVAEKRELRRVVI